MKQKQWKRAILALVMCLACVLAGCAAPQEKAAPTEADKYAQAQKDL